MPFLLHSIKLLIFLWKQEQSVMMMEEKRRSEDHEEEGVVKTVTAAGNKNKRDEWSEAGILTLLDAYESKWSLRNRAKLKGSDWEEIAFHVSSSASLKNPNQCKNKIESMKKKYRLESNSNSNSRPCSSWPFYARMHQLLHPFKSTKLSDDENFAENNHHHHVVVEGSNNHNNESDDDDETAPPPPPPPPVVEKREDEVVGDEEKRRRKRKGRLEEEGENEYFYLGESIRLVGRCIMKIEQGRIDMYRECEKMRLESEMKRAELDLQRTQIVASTQLQIANLFANTFLNNNNTTTTTQPQPQPQPQPSSLVDTTATTTRNKLA